MNNKTSRNDNVSEPIARKRLKKEDRELEIAQAAVAFFAEVGFDGDTRELAKRLGVTQSLIFRYFPNKAALIDRVFQEVYVGRWNPYWETVLIDRAIPLEDRLIRFYQDYSKTSLTYDWVRLFLFSGLKGQAINERYLSFLRSRVFEAVAIELRDQLRLVSSQETPIKIGEIELVASLDAQIFYLGQRQWVFNSSLESPLDTLIVYAVTSYIEGAKKIVPQLVGLDATTD
jgi:AcrR family transcriptional regulator